MSNRLAMSRLASAIVLVCAASMVLAGSALGMAVAHPRVGKLSGFPMVRGMVPVLASSAAVSAHEKLVKNSFAAVRSQHDQGLTETPVPNEQPLARCTEEFEEELSFYTQDMCYRGGPVLHKPTLHLIFWQGPTSGVPPAPGKFPSGYVEAVERYFTDIAEDSHRRTNVFAVDAQYGDELAGKYVPGEYALTFEPSKDVYEDTLTPLPNDCTDKTEYSEGPCVLDSEIQKEVKTTATLKSWPTESLADVYLVFTPPNVGSCFEASEGACAYKLYCAYHGDFGGNGETPGNQTLYVNLPYIGNVRGCDSGVHPNEELAPAELDHGEDIVVDAASHELNEAVTDPLGSQCNENGSKEIVGCEKNAWTDAIGQEVGDKCLPPETTIAGLNGIYGEPLVEGLGVLSYNQVINGHHYWTQREWSNAAGLFEGACVQQVIEASFTSPSGVAATVPATFNGSASGAPGDPATYWVWDFGDGERVGASTASVSHTYAKPGTYLVTVTAYDAFGSSAWNGMIIEVGAPPPPPAPPATAINTVTITTPPPPILAYSASQIAEKLGLPRNGTKMSGLGTLSLGHAACPPACAVTLNLTATILKRKHNRHVARHVIIGALRMTVANKGTGKLAVELNASGRALLHKLHLLTCSLLVRVEGQEGGSWATQRTLTLTSSARSARQRR